MRKTIFGSSPQSSMIAAETNAKAAVVPKLRMSESVVTRLLSIASLAVIGPLKTMAHQRLVKR